MIFCGAASSSALAAAAAATAGLEDLAFAGSVIANNGGPGSIPGKNAPSLLISQLTAAPTALQSPVTPRKSQIVQGGVAGGAIATMVELPAAADVGGGGAGGAAGIEAHPNAAFAKSETVM